MKRVSVMLLLGYGIVSVVLVQAQAVPPFKLGTFQIQARTFVLHTIRSGAAAVLYEILHDVCPRPVLQAIADRSHRQQSR